jgi:hypothetical protein
MVRSARRRFQVRSHPPVGRAGAFERKTFEVSLAVTKEITHPNHRERHFMQHLRGVGWIMARTLPLNGRTVKNLLQRGWIEQQHQGPKNEVFLRLTDKGLEAKKSPIPIRRIVSSG